jgi:hypothetical protein
MTEENQEMKTGMFESKFWRTTLIIIAALLVFAGPTYMIHVLIISLGVDYWVSMATGFVVFIVGLLLLVYLFRKKVIS